MSKKKQQNTRGEKYYLIFTTFKFVIQYTITTFLHVNCKHINILAINYFLLVICQFRLQLQPRFITTNNLEKVNFTTWN